MTTASDEPAVVACEGNLVPLMKILMTCLVTAAVILLTVAFGLALVGCDTKPQPTSPITPPDFIKGLAFGQADISSAVSGATSIETYLGITDFGEGVYYFPYTGDTFGKALAKFRKEKPGSEVVSIAGDSDRVTPYNSETKMTNGKLSRGAQSGCDWSVTTHAGYWVITRKL